MSKTPSKSTPSAPPSKPSGLQPLPRKRPADFRTERLESFDKSWRSKRLPSGLTLIHAPDAATDHFFLGVIVRAGSRLERPKEMGVSHFLEHMMFRGSERYPEFTRLAEAFEWLGGDWNAATGHEHTEYWYSGIRHTAEEVIELFADFMERPRLTDLEVERSIILRELDGETNDHGHSTDLDYHIATLLWPGSTLAQPILGTPETLAAIDDATLRAYRDRFYTPQNIAVTAVGGGDAVFASLEKHFGRHRDQMATVPPATYPKLPDFRGPAVKWVEHSDNEYEIRLSFLAASEWSEDAPVFDLVTRILSDGFASRLARRLREELGLVYDIGATTTFGVDAGTFDVHASCSVDQLDEFLRELFTLLREFAVDGPTEDELDRAIVRAVVGIELSPSHPEGLGGRLGWATLCGRRLSLAQECDRLKAVTAKRMADVVSRAFRPENAALVALGPEGKDIEGRLRTALVQGLKH